MAYSLIFLRAFNIQAMSNNSMHGRANEEFKCQ